MDKQPHGDSYDEELLGGDRFVEHWCVACGARGALFATPRVFAACPECLLRRIHRLQATRFDLPAWVAHLEMSATCETRRQERAERDSLTVSFDDFYRCGGCGTLVPAREARYRLDASPSPPYCCACHSLGRYESGD